MGSGPRGWSRPATTQTTGASPLIWLTEHSRVRYAALQRRQVTWINELAAGLKVSELSTAARVLEEMSSRLNDNAHRGGEER